MTALANNVSKKNWRVAILLRLIVWILFTPTNLRTTASAISISPSTTKAPSSSSLSPPHFLLVGGTGRIGTSIAQHLQLPVPDVRLTLLTRRRQTKEMTMETTETQHNHYHVSVVSTKKDIWEVDNPQLQELIDSCDCVIHTAGPYYPDQRPTVLEKVIQSSRCQVYLDVSDPLPFLQASLDLDTLAKANNKTCLLAAGAFPGLSNVLAMEAAAQLLQDDDHDDSMIHNVFFQFFTSGLGGIGDVNLYITNLGFGEPMTQMQDGRLRSWRALSGKLLGRVDFGDNIVGSQQVFAWPFPEAATVAKELNATGDSVAAMGTAPDMWNSMMGVLVNIVPRSWWRSKRFSKFMADFSQPMVKLSDAYLKAADVSYGTGETHAMRIDVTRRDSSGVTITQGHRSFRECVGQYAAEFALDCLQHGEEPGVFLPEQRYREQNARKRIVDKLTTTPGTCWYSGAVATERAVGPNKLKQALVQAQDDEACL